MAAPSTSSLTKRWAKRSGAGGPQPRETEAVVGRSRERSRGRKPKGETKGNEAANRTLIEPARFADANKDLREVIVCWVEGAEEGRIWEVMQLGAKHKVPHQG
jgi:hypothetical protein